MHNKFSLLHFSLASTVALVSAMSHAEAIRSE